MDYLAYYYNYYNWLCSVLKEDVADDDIDALLKTIEDTNGLTLQSEHSGGADGRSPIYVEHR